MTSTRSAAATGLPEGDFPTRQTALFEQRHAEWLQARAELATLHLTDSIDPLHEAEVNRACDRVDDLVRALMTTYCNYKWMISVKFQIFEEAIQESDAWTDRKQIWMLGCIKADFLAHSFGGNA